ncbi:MAG: DUF58 domain-containing protein [Desulfobulbus propionicus]|nr:MAG: DUF58 domain-containing protein [Desulfobulbus propionicus]
MNSLKRNRLFAPETSGRKQPQQPSSSLAVSNLVRITIDDLIDLRARAGRGTLPVGKKSSRQAGSYRSVFRGRGMEFAEARPYQQGDDIRTIDWRLTARLGKPHTKLFQEERDRAVILWVDLHPSMFFASKGVFKAVQAARAAGLFAWSAAARGDRLGGIIFAGEIRQELRPGLGDRSVLRFFRKLCEHPAWENQQIFDQRMNAVRLFSQKERQTSMTEHLIRLCRVSRNGNLIILLSDMRALSQQAEQQLGRLARDNQVLVCFLHDPLEKELPPPGWYRLGDGQHTLSFYSGQTRFRQHYAKGFQNRQQQLQTLCHQLGIDFLPLSTTEHVDIYIPQQLSGLYCGGGRGMKHKMSSGNRILG